jgi:hypothetical protein
VLSALAVLLACMSGACSSDSSSGGPPPPFSVVATPDTGTFPGPSTMVTLAVASPTMPNPVIHYTTDLTEPTAASPVYAGPFTIAATTVVKAIAINPDLTQTPIMVKGYVLVDGPYRAAWAMSGHGNIEAEAFRYWDDDGDVKTSCARCHGAGGMKDYLVDGTVDAPGALPYGHDCDTCHEPVAPLTVYDWKANFPFIEPVDFPSMDQANLWSAGNICITCHQGRESGNSVDADIMAGPPPYTFINIHYYAAGASYFGAETNGGYEYAGLDYAGRNNFPAHPPEQRDCVGCHMRGDLKDHVMMPQVSDCTSCHTGSSFETLGGTPSSNYQAIKATEPELLSEIQDYAANTLGFPIAYTPTDYPYFVHDTNGNGVADPPEIGFGNRYDEFDAALLKAAYNYQASKKEPGGYIHNGVYIRQLINDSIEDLGGVPSVPAPGRPAFDLLKGTVSEQYKTSGHADSTAEAFRHWDPDGEVKVSCAKCHTSTGFVDFIEDGVVDAPAPLGQTVECAACHSGTNLFVDSSTRHDDPFTHPELEPVTFPSGATATFGTASNICMSCHQGRESGVSIDTATPNTVMQTPVEYPSYDFINRHYYAAGAILFGADVTAAYEYAGQNYVGQNLFPGHQGGRDNCLGCHMRRNEDHSFVAAISDCTECHFGITEFEDMGLAFGQINVDWDANGIGESFDAEIKGLAATLYAEIQSYANVGLPQASPVVYSPAAYPYWFHDTNANGALDPGEDSYGNRYRDFDLELLRAAFNYHSAQDPCGDMHNYRYVLQSVFDSADMLDDGLLNQSVLGNRP